MGAIMLSLKRRKHMTILQQVTGKRTVLHNNEYGMYLSTVFFTETGLMCLSNGFGKVKFI